MFDPASSTAQPKPGHFRVLAGQRHFECYRGYSRIRDKRSSAKFVWTAALERRPARSDQLCDKALWDASACKILYLFARFASKRSHLHPSCSSHGPSTGLLPPTDFARPRVKYLIPIRPKLSVDHATNASGNSSMIVFKRSPNAFRAAITPPRSVKPGCS